MSSQTLVRRGGMRSRLRDSMEGELEREIDRRGRDYIRWVQRSLNQVLQLRLAEDGALGPKTRSAIRAFQQSRGLAVDGIVGAQTERALRGAGAGPPPGAGSPPAPAPPPTPGTFRPVPVEAPGGGRVRDRTSPRPADLVTVAGVGGRRIQLHRLAASAWQALVAAARADGIREPLLLPTSGFRDPAHQERLWREALQKYGSAEEAQKWVAPPGGSAHQTGRAIDFQLGGSNSSSNVAALRQLPAYHWLVANAERFGFYPYEREPWHWEYNPPQSAAQELEFDGELEFETSRGREYIRWVQQALNRVLGVRLGEDGLLGAQTRSAIRRFQKQSGLAVDGIVGSRTEQALRTAAASSPPSGGANASHLSWREPISKPLNLPKPRLPADCYARDIVIGTDQEAFEQELMKWMSRCVTSRTINPKTGKPWRREQELIENATGIQEIFDYVQRGPTSMRLGGKRKVYAHFSWGRLNNGQWWIRGVGFSIIGRVDWKPPPEPPEPTFKLRDVVFRVDDKRINTFAIDVAAGDKLVQSVIKKVYDHARRESKLPENPIKTPSMKDLGKTFKDVVTGGGIPYMKLAEMAIGSWLQATINTLAGDVAKVRRRAYVHFIAGFLEVILLQAPQTPTDPFDKKYYDLGKETARQYSEEQHYLIQLSLLRYSMENPTTGWRPTVEGLGWQFPDDYKRGWHPGLMADALYNQLYRTKYSVD